MWLVRPFPVARLDEARHALRTCVDGDVRPMMALYGAAAAALAQIDPEEVEDARQAWRLAPEIDRVAARAAVACAEAWEETVSVGATIRDPQRFRGFAWLAAAVRTGLVPANPDVGRLLTFGRGATLPRTRPDDAALYGLLPALIGLGPELPDEVDTACPMAGTPVWQALGLSPGDWVGVDPVDGFAVSPEACRAAYAGLAGAWRLAAARGTESGLLVRSADPGTSGSA